MVGSVRSYYLALESVLYLQTQMLLSNLLVVDAVVVHNVQQPIGFGSQKGDRFTPCVCLVQYLLATFKKTAVVYQEMQSNAYSFLSVK